MMTLDGLPLWLPFSAAIFPPFSTFDHPAASVRRHRRFLLISTHYHKTTVAGKQCLFQCWRWVFFTTLWLSSIAKSRQLPYMDKCDSSIKRDILETLLIPMVCFEIVLKWNQNRKHDLWHNSFIFSFPSGIDNSFFSKTWSWMSLNWLPTPVRFFFQIWSCCVL